MRIREAKAEDAPQLVAFQVAMALETEGLRLDSDVVSQGVRGVFEQPTRGQYWVATDSTGESIVGCMLVLPEWSDWRNGTVLWIHSVYVLPEHRGKGVFRALYSHLKEEVKASSQLRGLRLYVDKGNLQAQEVYRSLGMSADHYSLFEWLK